MHTEPVHSPSGRVVGLLALLWRWRRLAGGTFLIIVAASVIAALVIPPKYTAHASFMPPPEELGGISAFLRSPLTAMLGRGGGASLDRLVGFLDSETTRRLLVDRYHLQAHYRARRYTDALIKLERATKVAVTPEGVVDVLVTDRDPELAAELANAYVDIVDSLYRRAESHHAGQLRRFLETRVAENQRALAKAESTARAFALRYGVISLPDQVEALINQMAEVEARIRALDVKIGAARQILGPEHYSVREMEIERAQLMRQKRRLMESSGSPLSDPLLSFREIPDRALEYARLEREIRIQSLIQEMLLQQYEMAKLEEARNVSSLTRVDRAVPPEVRSWPRRRRIVIVSAVMGIVWAILLAYLAEVWPGLWRRITADRAAPR